MSVVREDREIVLEDAFLREGGSAENPQNRWWGCEVNFRRSCDELFGVDHNKQMVANFTQAAKTLARDDRPRQIVLDEMGVDDDIVYTIVADIRGQTQAMMENIRQMFAQKRKPTGAGGGKKTPEGKAVRTQTDADKEAIESGAEKKTHTDIDREEIATEEREAGLAEQFIASGQPENEARELARVLVQEDLSYQFNPAQLDGYQMFNVRSNQGVLHINLNTDHPIYDLISHVEDRLSAESDESDPAFQAIVALRLLLSSWARMEDQTESRDERTRIQDISMNWGRQVDKVYQPIAGERRLSMRDSPGDLVTSLCSNAQSVVIVAPYIKADALSRVLATTSAEASLTCVTKWDPHDLAVGASDAECRSLGYRFWRFVQIAPVVTR